MNFLRLLILSLMATGSVCAKPEKPPRPGGPGNGPGRSFGSFFETADTNGDGKVSAEEFGALERISQLPEENRTELFNRFDKDGDGFIQRHEMRPPRQEGGKGRPMPGFREMDRNQDGKVSFEEFGESRFGKRIPPERLKQFFERLDSNGDGFLTSMDRPKHRGGPRDRKGPPRPGGNLIPMLDKDGDAKLSFEEFRKAPWIREQGEDAQEDRFEALDKNDDQLLDSAEAAEAKPAPSTRRGGGKRDRDERGPRPSRPERSQDQAR